MTMVLAVLDACVLYPPSLRDLLMRIAITGAYEPRWTEQIHDEWIRNVLADRRQVTPAQLERTRHLMDQAIPNCLVSGYEAHIAEISLPDLNDRHVLAAAIKAHAPLIITFNLSDFPKARLQEHGVQAVHPDVFLSGLFDELPELVLGGLQEHRASLNTPPKTAAEYIATLRANSLKTFALRVEIYHSVI